MRSSNFLRALWLAFVMVSAAVASYISQGGGGSVGTLRGTFASIPTCNLANKGATYWATDAGLEGTCNASSWFYRFGSIQGIVPTSSAAVSTWYNQTSATVVDVPGGVILTGTPNGGANIQGRLVALPATPYTAIVCLANRQKPNNYAQLGLLVTNGTAASSAAIIAGNGVANGYYYLAQQYNSATSFSGDANGVVYQQYGDGPQCYGLSDNGTTRRIAYSYDGQNWFVFVDSTHTNFLTATHAGYGVNSNQSNGTLVVQVYSWQVVNSALF
jgi:hypothetical protein